MIANYQTITAKVQTLYVAYAPDEDVCCYGACFEEAVNGLTQQLHDRATGDAERDATPKPALSRLAGGGENDAE